MEQETITSPKPEFIRRASAAPNQIQLGLALVRSNGTLIYMSNLIQCSAAELIMLDAACFL